ncbi:unnamed protein product [Dibothriocephalus latus]|uniref:Uncharacterized protein n=1 Tax=Dibothriocephalus latus TaxID=60516 RepID=A0A3P7RPR1_DIBLA|nr:unnamed protein product [Dibothriocephalus latus]
MGIDSSEIADVPATTKSMKRSGTSRVGVTVNSSGPTNVGLDRPAGTSTSASNVNSTKKEDKKGKPKSQPSRFKFP